MHNIFCLSSTSKKWELTTWNLGQIFEIEFARFVTGQYYSRWLFKADCPRNLHQSSSCQSWSLHGFQTLHFICDQLGCKFGCNRFRITPDIVSKLLLAAIWRRCAVLFEFEQTPFSRTGCWFRSAALHRIRFGTCCFVAMSYFYSETNDWLKDGTKPWAQLWSATTPLKNKFHRKIKSHQKKTWLVTAGYLQSIKTFLTQELSQYHKRVERTRKTWEIFSIFFARKLCFLTELWWIRWPFCLRELPTSPDPTCKPQTCKRPFSRFWRGTRTHWRGASFRLLLPSSSEHLTLFKSVRCIRKSLQKPSA